MTSSSSSRTSSKSLSTQIVRLVPSEAESTARACRTSLVTRSMARRASAIEADPSAVMFSMLFTVRMKDMSSTPRMLMMIIATERSARETPESSINDLVGEEVQNRRRFMRQAAT